MLLKMAIDKGIEQLHSVLNLEVSSIAAASRSEDGWQLIVEMIERRAVPDTQDLLGTYNIHLDDEGNIVSYERQGIRRRMDLVEELVE
jgi:hypothetical protein